MRSASLLKDQFIKNGVDVSCPVDQSAIDAFERNASVQLSRFIKDLHLEFDGFHLSDSDNMLCLWPLKRIEEEKTLAINFDGHVFNAIGDFWIDADFLMTSLTMPDAPVVLHSERRVLAPDLEKFLYSLAAGKLNIFGTIPHG